MSVKSEHDITLDMIKTKEKKDIYIAILIKHLTHLSKFE